LEVAVMMMVEYLRDSFAGSGTVAALVVTTLVILRARGLWWAFAAKFFAWFATFAVLWFARFGPTVTFAARLAGTCFRATFGTRAALRAVAFEAGLIAVAANVGARLAAFGAARRLAGGAELIDADLAVAVTVEFAEDVGGLTHFLGVDDAVVIGVESGEDSGHRTRRVFAANVAIPAVFAFATGAVGARRTFATRFCLGPWAGFAARFAVTRGTGWTCVGVVLGGEGPRGEREGHCSGEEVSGIHRWSFWVAAD
jgi:hypothetical protein